MYAKACPRKIVQSAWAWGAGSLGLIFFLVLAIQLDRMLSLEPASLIGLSTAKQAFANSIQSSAFDPAQLQPVVQVTVAPPPITSTLAVTPGSQSNLYLPVIKREYPAVAEFGVDFTRWVTIPELLEYDFPVAHSMGADWVRVYLPWFNIEPVRGQYLWEPFDEVFQHAALAGLQPLVVIYGWPAWVSETGCGPVDDLDAFDAFLRAAWERYGNVAHAWEFANEPDGWAPHYWGSIIGCWSAYPCEYANQLHIFHDVFKGLDPDCLIVYGGLAYDNWAIFDRGFFESTLECGAGAWFDVLNFHYYPINYVDFPTMASKAQELLDTMHAHGVHKKHVWVTETGMWVNAGGSLEAQKNYIVREFTRAQAVGVDNFFWFEVQQPFYEAPLHRWLISREHMPDNAYYTFQQYTRMMKGVSFRARYMTVPEGVEAYRFAGLGHVLYVLWANDGQEHQMSLPASADAFLSDRDGTSKTLLLAENDQISFAVGPVAVYVHIPASAYPPAQPTATSTPPGVPVTPTPTVVQPTATPTPTLKPVPDILLADSTWELILGRVRSTALDADGRFPEVTKDGVWRYSADGGWTGGFWTGLLWLAYERTGDAQYRQWAEAACQALDPRQNDTSTHDVGMIFYNSYVNAYRLTGDARYRDAAFAAAHALMQRYNAEGGYIQAWGPIGDPELGGRTIVDTMMNLPILWWAWLDSGDASYLEPALAHNAMAVSYHVRPDGSTVHACDLDPETGELLRQTTVQGYSDDSCWSRGQAWAIYGFTLAAERTWRADTVQAAEATADYFLAHLPADYVPYWDFVLPSYQNEPRDSSAAAIAASGLLELAQFEPDVARRQRYWEGALNILESLTMNYINWEHPDADGILLHGCSNRPAGVSMDESLIWGDYYYVEAMMRLARLADQTGG